MANRSAPRTVMMADDPNVFGRLSGELESPAARLLEVNMQALMTFVTQSTESRTRDVGHLSMQ